MPACSRACSSILPWPPEWLLDRGVGTDRKPLAGDTPGGRFSFAPAYGRSSTGRALVWKNQWLRVRFLPSMRSTILRDERACVLTNPQRNTKERDRPVRGRTCAPARPVLAARRARPGSPWAASSNW